MSGGNKMRLPRGGKGRIQIDIVETKNTEELLSQMPLELREKHLRSAVRKAGNIVAKEARRRCPKPGYPGDNPTKTPLNRTITTKTRVYPKTVTAFVGPKRPHGAHGHLVEYGFSQKWVKMRDSELKVKRKYPKQTRAKPFMRPAAHSTIQQQKQAIVDYLKSKLKELARPTVVGGKISDDHYRYQL